MTIHKKIGYQTVTKCRICGSGNLIKYLDLDSMPIPNGFVTAKNLSRKETYYPLQISYCRKCTLSQLNQVVSPVKMFKNYLYIPSTSENLKKHFKKLAADTQKFSNHLKYGLVIDIGSNDGTLLGYFKKLGYEILGIDPAGNLAKSANKKHIPTINEYFTSKLAGKLAKSAKARIITATNVMAHIDDLNDAVEGVKILLDDHGVFVIETPYILDLLNKNEFDTIYHEHLSYFSVQSLLNLFKKHYMRIIDIKRQSIHGGSILVYATHGKNAYKISSRVKAILDQEKNFKLQTSKIYKTFAGNVDRNKILFIKLLERIKKRNKIIAGVGAAAKGNVFLNYYKLGTKDISYIVDSIQFKQGKYTPGTHIPIFPEDKLKEEKIDYLIIFAWNFAGEIMKKQKKFYDKGGKFIICFPKPKII